MEDKEQLISKEQVEKSIAWANRPKEEEKELVEKAEREGLDKKRLLLGHALAVISGDDSQIFSSFIKPSAENLNLSKKQLLLRLEWEESHDYLPGSIKEVVGETRERLEKLDWTEKGGLRRARKIWQEKVLERVKEGLKSDQSLQTALNYYEEKVLGYKSAF